MNVNDEVRPSVSNEQRLLDELPSAFGAIKAKYLADLRAHNTKLKKYQESLARLKENNESGLYPHSLRLGIKLMSLSASPDTEVGRKCATQDEQLAQLISDFGKAATQLFIERSQLCVDHTTLHEAAIKKKYSDDKKSLCLRYTNHNTVEEFTIAYVEMTRQSPWPQVTRDNLGHHMFKKFTKDVDDTLLAMKRDADYNALADIATQWAQDTQRNVELEMKDDAEDMAVRMSGGETAGALLEEQRKMVKALETRLKMLEKGASSSTSQPSSPTSSSSQPKNAKGGSKDHKARPQASGNTSGKKKESKKGKAKGQHHATVQTNTGAASVNQGIPTATSSTPSSTTLSTRGRSLLSNPRNPRYASVDSNTSLDDANSERKRSSRRGREATDGERSPRSDAGRRSKSPRNGH